MGFKFGGDEFAMIINDKEDDIGHMNAKEIIFVLMDNIGSNCQVTISVGLTNYLPDNKESYSEWFDRANKYLKDAKNNGKNRACWGQNIKELMKRAKSSSLSRDDLDDLKEDDLLFIKSLENIEVSQLFVYPFHIDTPLMEFVI